MGVQKAGEKPKPSATAVSEVRTKLADEPGVHRWLEYHAGGRVVERCAKCGAYRSGDELPRIPRYGSDEPGDAAKRCPR